MVQFLSPDGDAATEHCDDVAARVASPTVTAVVGPATVNLPAAPLPTHEYLLQLDPAALLLQIARLDELQQTTPDACLLGLRNFLAALGEQAYLRYGLPAINESALAVLHRTAHAANLPPAAFATAVAAAAQQAVAVVNAAGTVAQLEFIVSQLGPAAARQLVTQLLATTPATPAVNTAE